MDALNTPPRILYKYRAINKFTYNMLTEGEIYFATTNELNDPMEKFFRRAGGYRCIGEHELPKVKYTKIEKTHTPGNYLVLLDADQETRYMRDYITCNESYGIFSLCECKDSICMYTHYADAFKGICIGFAWEQLGLEFAGSYPPQSQKPQEVRYLKAPLDIHGSPSEWLNVFLSKSEDFSWEKEWRMFYTNGKKIIPKVAIREIIFGFRFFEKDKENMWLTKFEEMENCIRNLQDVNLFIAEPKIGRYELEITPKTQEEIFSLLANDR